MYLFIIIAVNNMFVCLLHLLQFAIQLQSHVVSTGMFLLGLLSARLRAFQTNSVDL